MTIATLTLNPTIDVSSDTDLVRPTHKVRTANEKYEPGGGGVNVARVIAELGGDSIVVCPAGGFSGRMLDELLGRRGIKRVIVPVAGNTRISFTVFERKTGHEFRFIPHGSKLSAREIGACLDAIRELEFDYFVASGSIPRGAPTDILAQVGQIVAEKKARFVLDSSGAGLSVTLANTKAYLVKPSMSELEALVGRHLDQAGVLEAATDIVKSGQAEIVAVTLGARGALVVTRSRKYHVVPPKMEAHSALGAGDAFVGAMTFALSEGRPVEDALILATAAGAATTLTPEDKVCAHTDVMRLRDMVRKGHLPRKRAR